MSTAIDPNEDAKQPDEKKEVKDIKREQTNKTDPQLTELKGFFDPKEPLEEEGTPNPLNPLTD